MLFGKKHRALTGPSERVQWPQEYFTPILIRDSFDAQIVFSRLEEYLEQLKVDLRHAHSDEDYDFYKRAIERTTLMITSIGQQHPNMMRRM